MNLMPLPGFDWSLVRWGAADATRTTRCSYMACNRELANEDEDSDEISLTICATNGSAAEFCTDCQVRWWGFRPEGYGSE